MSIPSSPDTGSPWVLTGIAILLVGLVLGAMLWSSDHRALGTVLLLGGVVGGPIAIGLFS
jgi:hypothetical protein